MKPAALLAIVLGSMLLGACSSGADEAQSSTLASQPVATTVPSPLLSSAESVVFMGDSITERWPSPPGYNAGRSGQATDEMLARFQRDVLDRHPSIVVILGGTNDVYRSDMPSTINVARMAELAGVSGACVVLGTLPPVLVPGQETTLRLQRTWNEKIHTLAASHGYLVADYRAAMEGKPELFVDGIHPNSAGYEVMLTVIEPVIRTCGSR